MQTATIIGIQASTAGLSFANIGGYVVPASTGAVVSHLMLANTGGSVVNVSVRVFNGTSGYFLVDTTPIAVGDTLDVLDSAGRIALAAGWSIQAVASIASSVDATMSVTQFV